MLIARRLDECGFDFVEGGYPASNTKDAEYFQRARELKLSHAKVCAFGMTRRRGTKPASDLGIQALVQAETPVVTIVGKTWDFHVTEVLRELFGQPGERGAGERLDLVGGGGEADGAGHCHELGGAAATGKPRDLYCRSALARCAPLPAGMRSGGRVVEGARLESVYTSKAYRGFESHPLRQLGYFPSPQNLLAENCGVPRQSGTFCTEPNHHTGTLIPKDDASGFTSPIATCVVRFSDAVKCGGSLGAFDSELRSSLDRLPYGWLLPRVACRH